MGQQLLETLQTMSPEEAEKLLRRVEELKAQQKTAATFQQVEAAKDVGAVHRVHGQNYGGIEKEKATRGMDLGRMGSALSGRTGTDAAEVDKLVDYVTRRGTMALGQQPGLPGQYGSDIEGALRSVPGAKGVARGDQYAAVDQSGRLLATRNEYPSLREHWNALGRDGDATRLGFAVNVLQSLARPAGTALNYGVDAMNGNTDDMTIRGFGADMLEALKGGKRGTVGEGGRVSAGRGAGFGDVGRLIWKRKLEQLGPDATTGQAFPDVPMPEYVANRPLADWQDEDFDFFGDVAGFALDPINVVGGKALAPVVGVAGKAAGTATSAASKVLPESVVSAASRAKEVALTDVTDLVRRITGAPITEGALAAGMRTTHGAAADGVARDFAAANVGARAQGQVEMQDVLRELQDIAPMVSSREAPEVAGAVESLLDLEDGAKLVRLRERLMNGQGPVRLLDDADRAHTETLRKLTDEDVGLLTKTPEEIQKAIDDDALGAATRLANMSDDDLYDIVTSRYGHDETALGDLVSLREKARGGASVVDADDLGADEVPIFRYDVDGAVDDAAGAAERPHGLYFHVGKDGKSQYAGGITTKKKVVSYGSAKPRNPLVVDGTNSAGWDAAKRLAPEEYARYAKLTEEELFEEIVRDYPEMEALLNKLVQKEGRGVVAYGGLKQIFDTWGALLARRKGYDAIIHSGAGRNFGREFVALDPGAIRRLHGPLPDGAARPRTRRTYTPGRLDDDTWASYRKLLDEETPKSILTKNARETLLERLRPVRNRQWDLARTHGVDLFRGYGDDVAEGLVGSNVDKAARRVAEILRRSGSREKALGLLGKDVRLEGYFPHPPKPKLGGALPRAYNPRARRYAVATENVKELRVSAHRLDGDEDAMALLSDEDRAFVHSFATNTAFQAKAENIARAKKVFADLDLRMDAIDETARVRADTFDEAAEVIEARSGGRVTTEQDPIKAVALHTQALAAGQARARLGEEAVKLGVARDPVQLIGEIGDDALKARVLRDLGEGAEGPAPGQFRGPHARFEGGVEAGRAGVSATDPEVLGALREKGWTIVNKDLAKKMPALEGKAIPIGIQREIERMAGKLEQGALDRAAALIGKLNQLWIPLVLNTPGFHIRNWIYGEFQTYLALGARAFRPAAWRQAFEVAAIAEGQLASQAVIKLGGRSWNAMELAATARRMGVVETGLVADLEGIASKSAHYNDEGLRGLFTQNLNPWSQKGIVGNEPVFKKVVNRGIARIQGGHAGQAGSATAENLQRMRVFLGRLDAGDDVVDAANAVTKYMFDYTGSQLSEWGKAIRRVMPFYQWVRFSTVQTVEEMIKQPHKFAHLARLFDMANNAAGDVEGEHVTASDPTEIPESLMERGASYVPEAIGDAFGLEQTPEQKWMLALERPGTALNFLDPLLSGLPSQFVVEKLLPQLSPAARVPVEIATGKYAFGGAPISPTFTPDDPTNSGLEAALNMKSEDMPGYFLPTLGGPWASMLAAGLGLKRNPKVPGSDEDERMFFQGVSNLAGVKLAPFNPHVTSKKRAMEDAQVLEAREAGRRREGRAQAADISAIERLILKITEGGGS
jgi:hypothetical protein